MDVMEKSEVGKVVTMMGAPLRQRLRSANDASTYAWFAFSAQGRKDAPPLLDDETAVCHKCSRRSKHGPTLYACGPST